MAERDVEHFDVIAQTRTSIELGVESYREVKISLEQDFGLARIIRGLGEKSLGILLKDESGNPVNTDGSVALSIYDAFNNEIYNDTETQTASGEYGYTYTPPLSASLGIYRATHTFEVSGSDAQIDEWFRVVSSVPGDYSGSIIRGEETWSGIVKTVDLLGRIVDPDSNEVLYTVRSPRGVVLVSNAEATRSSEGNYVAEYEPGYNDALGDYYVTFTYTIAGSAYSNDLFFNVREREGELIVGASEFKNTPEGKQVASLISNWSDETLEAAIADSQDRIERCLGYKIGKHIVSGERREGTVNSKNEIFVDFGGKPVYKLLRALMVYHPSFDPLTLPASAWNIYHESSQAKYVFEAGQPYNASIENILRDYTVQDKVDLILDYEAGYDKPSRTIKQAIRALTSATIEDMSGNTDIKRIKSGNHVVEYFDSLRGGSTMAGNSAMSRAEQRVFEMLRMSGFRRPPIV